MKDVDYSHYLGKDYKIEYNPPKRGGEVATKIAPHVSIFDICVLNCCYKGICSYVAGDFVRNIPFIGKFAVAGGCIFVSRNGSKNDQH